jgi:hypothetical protein
VDGGFNSLEVMSYKEDSVLLQVGAVEGDGMKSWVIVRVGSLHPPLPSYFIPFYRLF